MGQCFTEVARPLLKHIGTYGAQAGRLAFVDSAVRCDLGRYRGQRGEDSEPDSVSQFSRGFLVIYSQPGLAPAAQFPKLFTFNLRMQLNMPLFLPFGFMF